MSLVDNKSILRKSVLDAQIAQKEMAQRVLLEDLPKTPTFIAGVDVSNNRFDPEKMIFAAIVVFSYPALEIVEVATKAVRQEFPYIPGLLGFREVPILMQVYEQLSIRPDLIMVDGHGISHPRGLGVASHLGVLLGIPTIGVAKSILVGESSEDLSEIPGSTVSLSWQEREVGLLLRSKKRASPLIISAGHLVTLKTATELVLTCLKGYRLPEPTRQAHLMANVCRRDFLSNKKRI